MTHGSDLVMTTDEQGIITYVAPSVFNILGYQPDDLVGTAAALLIDPEHLDRLAVEVASILDEHKQSIVVECRVQHCDGRWLDLEAVYTNLLADPTVRGIVVNAHDVTGRNQLVSELAHKAFHDDLTGLANRALLRDRLDHALRRSRRSSAIVSVLFCDLDGFKMINDSLGHDVGDLLLASVARRLEQSVREVDTTARLGGDEFAILLDDSDPKIAATLARRIVDALREPVELNGREIYIRASIGVADNADEVLDADELLQRADIAMYAAKARGRDRYEVFSTDMQSELTARHELHGDLRHALERDELRLQYQPLVDLSTNRIESFEALVRWHHPTRGLVGPNQFIPVAEETGLILPIGEYVLNEACRQLAEWRRTVPLGDDVTVGVNAAAMQLHDADFLDVVQRALTSAGLPARNLVIELTESTLLSDTALVQRRLLALKELGVSIAIDDFGTGYSSLAYLRNFPVDYLKIDKSFVDELNSGAEQDQIMVRSIIGLGHNLHLRVIAEGIEEPSQLEQLCEANCDIGQGYLFARRSRRTRSRPPSPSTTRASGPRHRRPRPPTAPVRAEQRARHRRRIRSPRVSRA